MEYLIIVGFVLVILIPTTYIFIRYSSTSSDTLSSAKANQIANEIVKAADEVYYLGTDNQKKIEVSFPSNIEVIEFASREIVFKIKDSRGNINEIVEVASVPLTGILPNIQGKKFLIIKSLGSTVSVSVACKDFDTLESGAATCSAFNCRSPCGIICINKGWQCAQCSDSQDNDGDGRIDFDGLGGALPDIQCSSRSDHDESA